MRLPLLFAAALTIQSHLALAYEDICEKFPQAFPSRTGIMVMSKEINGLPGCSVSEFIGRDINRNHYDERGGAAINTLVMHYTHSNFADTMNTFTTNVTTGRVSAHYVITQKEGEAVAGGSLFQLVPDEKRAWHAGISYWRGMKNLNANSIGIENVNRGYELSGDVFQWFPFDHDQISILGKLSQGLVSQYGILPYNVVGHADIAPTRKQDPGILFPWETLYETYGVGAWLAEDERDPVAINEKFKPENEAPREVDEEFFLNCLKEYGYEIPEGTHSITKEAEGIVLAFKSHFSKNQQPHNYTSKIDEEDMLWAWGLTAKYPR